MIRMMLIEDAEGERVRLSKIYRKNYYRKNREKLLEYQRQYYNKKNNKTDSTKRINKKSNWRGEKIYGGFIKKLGSFTIEFK